MGEKCRADDPRRCKSTTPNGQCKYLALEDREHCSYHSKGRGYTSNQRKEVERYLIDHQRLRQSYNKQKGDLDYLDMKQEILLLHALIEQKLNTIKHEADLTMAIPGVSQLLQRLESMKVNLMKIQQQLGITLSKDHLRHLAIDIATILDEELTGIPTKDELLEAISDRIFAAIEDSGKTKGENHG